MRWVGLAALCAVLASCRCSEERQAGPAGDTKIRLSGAIGAPPPRTAGGGTSAAGSAQIGNTHARAFSCERLLPPAAARLLLKMRVAYLPSAPKDGALRCRRSEGRFWFEVACGPKATRSFETARRALLKVPGAKPAHIGRDSMLSSRGLAVILPSNCYFQVGGDAVTARATVLMRVASALERALR